METFIKDKKLNTAVLLLVIIISVFTLAKLVNEIKENKYVGRGNQPANTISVTGEGEVLAVSDIATLSISLNKDGKTAKEAQDLLNVEITNTLKYLSEQKVEDKDIKSEYGGVSPKYSYEKQIPCFAYPCPTVDPKIAGYTATQSISIKIRDVDNANIVRTGLSALGVTDISGPTFSIDNEENLKDSARSLAIKDAKEKAQVLANELDVKLVSVVTFYENTNGGYGMYAEKAMMDSSTTPAPVLPKGENKITSNVTITYEIR